MPDRERNPAIRQHEPVATVDEARAYHLRLDGQTGKIEKPNDLELERKEQNE